IRRNDLLDFDGYAMSGKMLCNIGSWNLSTLGLIADDNNLNRLCALEYRDGIANGARSVAAAVPAHKSAVEPGCAPVHVWNDTYRSSGIKQSSFDHHRIRTGLVRVCLSNNG